MKKKSQKINWFWAHRRNASLHQFGLLMSGLSGKGWMPAVDFWFNNQIVVGIPGKGCFAFYDRDQLSSKDKYRDVQRSIDNNPNFVNDFKIRTSELFGAIFFKCIVIDNENLILSSQEDLLKLYQEFITTMIVAPIITVQLWGIEACLDDNYRIIKFLKKRLRQLKKEGLFQEYKEKLTVNMGETVAFTEQKDFYKIAGKLSKPKIAKIFKNKNISLISKNLKKFPYENSIFEKHINKYEWMHTEYVGVGWTREKWVGLFRDAIIDKKLPGTRLDEILNNFELLNNERRGIIKELNPPKDVIHSIEALAELISQRDWAKGYFTKILLSYNNLLNEIARRIGITLSDIYYYSHVEVEDYLKHKKIISNKELIKRKKEGFVIVIKNGNFSLTSGSKNINKIIREEKISEPFDKVVNIHSFKGLSASAGKIKGMAYVTEDASTLSDFKKGDILVTYMTTIEFIPAFRKASAVITDEGGMSCHAAIISREFKLPCIVGTKIATRAIQTGDLIEVDANNGIVKILKKA